MATLDKFKLTAAVWDSDKNPDGFLDWFKQICDLVRSLNGGNELVEWVYTKLGIQVRIPATTPAFISTDPEFDFPGSGTPVIAPSTPGPQPASIPYPSIGGRPLTPVPETRGTGDAGSTSSITRSLPLRSQQQPSTTSSSNLRSTGVSWSELSAQAKELDKYMFSILGLNLKGRARTLLNSAGGYPSFVAAICILYKNMDLSKSLRRTNALLSITKITLKDDIQEWVTELLSAINEVYESGATLEDFILIHTMQSIQGKSKTVQYLIADDINQRDENTTFHIYDLIHKYATLMASVGDATKSAVTLQADTMVAGTNYLGKKVPIWKNATCSKCQQKGHKMWHCPKRSRCHPTV